MAGEGEGKTEGRHDSSLVMPSLACERNSMCRKHNYIIVWKKKEMRQKKLEEGLPERQRKHLFEESSDMAAERQAALAPAGRKKSLTCVKRPCLETCSWKAERRREEKERQGG